MAQFIRMNHKMNLKLCAQCFKGHLCTVRSFANQGFKGIYNKNNHSKPLFSRQLKSRVLEAYHSTTWSLRTLTVSTVKFGPSTHCESSKLGYTLINHTNCVVRCTTGPVNTDRRYYFAFLFRNMVSKKVENFKIRGLVSPPVTAFRENGDINLEIIPDYVQHFIDFGIPNAFVTGTTGEGNCMTIAERKAVAEAWVTAAKGRLSSVTIHIGAGNLRESQELARHAEEIGADAISCVGPTYHKPESLEQYVLYMRDVAAAAPETPFILYDIDFYTGIPYTAAEFFGVAHKTIPTLKGVKHTSPNLVSMSNILAQHGDKYQVLMGTDEFYLEGMALGLEISICSSYLGNVHHRMKEAFDRGDIETARREQKRAVDLLNLKRKHGLGVPGFAKAILRALGLAVGNPRCPHKPIEDELVQTLRKDMKGIGFNDWGMMR